MAKLENEILAEYVNLVHGSMEDTEEVEFIKSSYGYLNYKLSVRINELGRAIINEIPVLRNIIQHKGNK